MVTNSAKSFSGQGIGLLLISFFGIFIYGLLAALPGAVLPTLERNQYLPNDSAVGTFLLVNAVGAVLAYLISGPVIDRVGKKFALGGGAALVVISMAGFALAVTQLSPGSALLLIFVCSLVLGLGANAIVAAGHALVADVAVLWRNAALNLLDICFGLGLAALPLLVQSVQRHGGIDAIFWYLAVATIVLILLLLFPRFPAPLHPEAASFAGAKDLFTNPSFVVLAIALFMYVGTEVSVVKWVVTFLERDARILAAQGLGPAQLQQVTNSASGAASTFFEQDPVGISIASFALQSLSLFAVALLAGRLVSAFLLGVIRMNSFVLLTAGSALTTIALIIAFTTSTPLIVRLGLMAAGFGMGPIFPTSVGLASVMMPKMSGTAMSLVMGIGFAGLLLIPPAVGYISTAAGGALGDVRTGLFAIIAASAAMLVLHVALVLRERRLAALRADVLEVSKAVPAD